MGTATFDLEPLLLDWPAGTSAADAFASLIGRPLTGITFNGDSHMRLDFNDGLALNVLIQRPADGTAARFCLFARDGG